MSGRRISRRSVLALAACTALGAVGCGRAEEYTGPELILRYAENQPEDYPTTQAALAFADLVAQRTEGRVKVVVYSGGGLGAEQSVIEQMQYGGIDFARVSLSQLAEQLPTLSVLQLPFLYTDAPQMWRVLDGEIGDGFLSSLGAMDLVGLSWFDAGVRSFYTREKVETLADLVGLTLPGAGVGSDERDDTGPRCTACAGGLQPGVCGPPQRRDRRRREQLAQL